MDSNSIPILPGGIYSNIQQPGNNNFLEMSLQQNTHQIPHHHQMVGFGHPEGGDYHPQSQINIKQVYPKSKNQTLTLSDDDEPGLSTDESKKKTSPWHRMKWTDNMVRLLIMVVFYIGDEVGSEGGIDPKKKSGGILQKKGKWKSVSRAMMERGFYVSPQQCEDKFNDLNKRYKRVNDIIGKGTACKVVENQSLLETMDHITPKLKDEVKKLLNSKHLFFKEMCAYHNSCGGGTSGTHVSSQEIVVPEPSQAKQMCLHANSNTNAPMVGRSVKTISSDDEEEDQEEEEDEEEEEEEDEDEVIGMMDERAKKRTRNGGGVNVVNSALVQQLDGELTSLLQDERRSAFEKSHWMKSKLMQLEENRVGIMSQGYEIEKQRLKWFKFSTKKEREMEREKLANERLKLENERMVLLVRKKELHMMLEQQRQQQQPSNKKSYHSSVTG